MKSEEIRKKFLDYFKEQNHAILDSASLVTPDEKGVTNSTLFNTAGVQPLIPYLLGEEHPKGNRLASVQKCIRTIDIDEVGDNTHLTFFEMLGNWSLGDYFKEDAIRMSFEFLTDNEKGLGLDPSRLYITVFEGDENSPKDEESFNIWKKYVPENRIYYMGAESNWWEAGGNGPCGPDTEMFYDLTEDGLGDLSTDEFIQADDDQKIVEIWNDVFMQFEKKDGKIIGNLPRQAVDTGAGLERLVVVKNNNTGVYETDLFSEILDRIGNNDKNRIITDHIRSAVMLISDGITPSNTDRGYILRRLIRRAVKNANNINIPEVAEFFINKMSSAYTEIKEKQKFILDTIRNEEDKFSKSLSSGLKEFKKISNQDISGTDAFKLFSSYGFPIELTMELANENNISVDVKSFKEEMIKHQEKSRTAAEGKFKGGLENYGEVEKKYHTATHLLHQALRDVLGEHVQQKGSNINSDRLRFDFSHEQKMTNEEKQKVEEIINQKIKDSLPVNNVEMNFDEAEKTGALHFFGDKYGGTVSIYYIGDTIDEAYSKEFCGGPHIKNTSELGEFKIKKEEASSAGVRRIKAVLK
jgi:alanyl-tRNA synthetase